MNKLLLILLLSFGFSTEWGTSFSVRTANGEDKPLVFLKMNRRNPLVVVDAKHFMRLNNSGYITDPVKVEYMDERKR